MLVPSYEDALAFRTVEWWSPITTDQQGKNREDHTAHVQGTFTRRQFIQATTAGSLALAGVGFGRVSWAQAVKPNIVFIMADDLGYADVSCYGQRDYTTPNIDRLAIEGLKFTQAYSNSANCSPTRTALITGRYQKRLAVGLEEPIGEETPKNVGLPPSHPTLPSLLKKAGYATTLVGKWHSGFLPELQPAQERLRPFLRYLGRRRGLFRSRRRSRPARSMRRRCRSTRHGYMTNLLGDRAVQTVEGYARSKEPFLLSLHFTAPHWPWEGPDDEAESSESGPARHHDGGTQKTYATMVQSLDTNIGRVLAGARHARATRKHDRHLHQRNGGERFSKIWPFSGMKGELLEGGLRIPAIVRWPGRVAAGSVSEQVMISMDWMPTLLAAAGTQPDPAYPPDGENLCRWWTGERRPTRAQTVLALQGRSAARRARRRLEVSTDCRQRVPVRLS